MQIVSERVPNQRAFDTPTEYHYLAARTHGGRQGQLFDLLIQLQFGVLVRAGRRLAQRIQQSTRQQKAGLLSVSEHVQARIRGCFGDGRKFDCNGNILKSGEPEWISVCLVSIMT